MRERGNRIALLAVDAFVAVTAIAGGLALATGLEGDRFPLALLERTPFTSYVLPGLILMVAVGGSATIAVAALLRGLDSGAPASIVASAILMGWIVGEVLLLNQPSWFEAFYFTLGLTMAGLGLAGNRTPARSASRPQEIASGVHCLEVGHGITRSNVYFVRSGAAWVLIDTASPQCAHAIQRAAEALFGADTPPTAILLTHDHPDHAGSTRDLAQRWDCLAYMHPDELPLATMDAANYLSTVARYANPLDRWLILPLLRVTPRRRRAALLARSSFKDVARL
jgi:hypothetical protein